MIEYEYGLRRYDGTVLRCDSLSDANDLRVGRGQPGEIIVERTVNAWQDIPAVEYGVAVPGFNVVTRLSLEEAQGYARTHQSRGTDMRVWQRTDRDREWKLVEEPEARKLTSPEDHAKLIAEAKALLPWAERMTEGASLVLEDLIAGYEALASASDGELQ